VVAIPDAINPSLGAKSLDRPGLSFENCMITFTVVVDIGNIGMPKKKLTDAMRMQLAQAYCLPVAGKLRSLSALGLDTNIVGPQRLTGKTVQRAIVEAFEKPLVRIVRPELPLVITRDVGLEAALEDRFRSKRTRAIVVKHEEKDLSGGQVNLLLGHALAYHISKNALFRDGDIIGIGTGRAVYHTVEAFRGLPGLDARDVSLFSLTGSMFPKNTASYLEYMLDADTVTMSFARYFRGLRTVRPISYPMAHTRTERDRLIKETFLFSPNFDANTPTFAIIGLGILSGDSRFAIEAAKSKGNSAIGAIYDNIRRLRQNITAINKSLRTMHDASSLEEVSLVGDYCNRLFRIHPRMQMPPDAQSLFDNELRVDIARINGKIITATKTQLSKVQTVALVAGTRQKAPAIRAILDHPFAAAQLLVTDEDAARAVLMIPDLPKATNSTVTKR
jgi:DNA-binding transcriptional regulator LsrR (DeoR family)